MSSPGKRNGGLKNNPWMQRDKKEKKDGKKTGTGNGSSRRGNSGAPQSSTKSSAKAEVNRRVNKRVEQLRNEERDDASANQKNPWGSPSEARRKFGTTAPSKKGGVQKETSKNIWKPPGSRKPVNQSSAASGLTWKPPKSNLGKTQPKTQGTPAWKLKASSVKAPTGSKKPVQQSGGATGKTWKPPKSSSSKTEPKTQGIPAWKLKAASGKAPTESKKPVQQSGGAKGKIWKPPKSSSNKTEPKTQGIPAWKLKASSAKNEQPKTSTDQKKAAGHKGNVMKPWKPSSKTPSTWQKKSKQSGSTTGSAKEKESPSGQTKARSKSPTRNKTAGTKEINRSAVKSFKSRAIEAAEAFSWQIAGGEAKEDDSDEDTTQPIGSGASQSGRSFKAATQSEQTKSKSKLANVDPILSKPIRSVRGRWNPRGTSPENSKRVSTSRQFNNHRAVTTAIQRLPPKEPAMASGSPVPVRLLSRHNTTVDPVKAKVQQQKIDERKGLKKRLLGKRPSQVLKWSILARNVGLAASLVYPIFGAFAMGWSGALQSQFRNPLEDYYLNTHEYVGFVAIGLGVNLHLIETYFGLVITAEKLLLHGILYMCSSVPAIFSNALFLPAALCLMTAALKILCIVAAEEGTVKLKPRNMCSSWRVDFSSSHTYVMIIYFFINIGVFLIRFYYYLNFVRLPCVDVDPTESTCISIIGVVAKGFGYTLNLNCACIFLPVLRVLMSKCVKSNHQSIRLNAQRLAAQNITMHRTIGWLVFLGVCGHVGCHYVNLGLRPLVTIDLFGPYSFTTGIMLVCTFIVMLAGLEPTIKRAHYAVFWKTHYFFLPFVLLLIAHAPEFWKWMVAPMVLFFIEKYYSKFVRGQTKFYLLDVEYLHPVTTLKFRPERDQDFRFEEGQYLLINVPHVSEYEWHPFTISSAYDDLCQSENGFVSISMKVTGENRWTDRVKNYFKELSGKMKYLKDEEGEYLRDDDGDMIQDPETKTVDFNSAHTRRDSKGGRLKSPFHHVDSKGKHCPGLLSGTDGKRIMYIDGPFQAPTQSYANYEDVMLVGSGIGLTPASAILRAVLKYKWKKGFKPRTLRFYWVLSHKEIGSYRWFIRLVARLLASYEFDKKNGALKFSGNEEHENYIEMNIYITSVPPNFNGDGMEEAAQHLTSSEEPVGELDGQIVQLQKRLGISEEDIHQALLHPTRPSSTQIDEQVYDDEKYPVNSEFNNLHLWVWKGRPQWGDIFHQVKVRTEEYSDGDKVGVCFCGNPFISQDLKTQCKRQSSRRVSFYLHSETFG